MGPYILRRMLFCIPVLFVSSIEIFGGVRFIPGDVCRLVLQTPDIDQKQCDAVNHSLGLDQPVLKQYVTWVGHLLEGNFGTSMISHRGVWNEIQHRMYLTVELAVVASIFAMSVAIPVGVYSALKQDKFADYTLRLLTIGWLSIPSFWIATMLITFPAKWWGYSPPVGFVQIWQDPLKNLQQIYMAAFALGLARSASLARLLRSTMLEVLRQDYVRTARAKGLQERVVLTRHALKNAMLPVITLYGLQVGFLLGGTVILEQIFALPGLGTLLITSVNLKDFTQVQGIVIFFAFIIVVVNLMVDLSYCYFDPRVRYS